MPAPYGLIASGFNAKQIDEVLADAQAKEQQLIDPNIDVQPTNPLGVLNGIMAAELADLWLLLLALYAGMDPDTAANDQLTGLALLTGTERQAPYPTIVTGCTVNVDASFSADPGTMFASITGNAAALFTNRAIVSNPAGVAANIDADFVAVNDGPQQCLAGTLTVISSALSGWNSITNPEDGIPGAEVETDLSLRIHREEELSAAGSSTADAIRADILKASEDDLFSSKVTSVTVLYNDTDAYDANGLSPHSIEVICYQPGFTSDDNLALATLILKSKGAGIGTRGLSSRNVTDDQGFVEVVYFTRPSEVDIWVAVTVTKDATLFPVDGATQIGEAITSYGDGLGAGGEVYAKHVASKVFDVLGVLDWTVFTIDTIDPPVGTANIVITVRQVAAFDTSRVAVTVV